ncbi:unnamed protein product [Adineta ricciae]|uniref:Uncharacterized protein n=1 Tax=Adineta ricciae TaxID=249248 RepID=A0A813QUQ8_ADIRI|nr:unnamed protein product [Adineta ricciae]CAF1163650.1 unnamed protein product [Adineta ricciae]
MSKLVCSLVVLTLFVAISHAISCYEHHHQCLYTPACTTEANKKNCTESKHQYCFKEENVFGLAIRGCAEASFCNTTVFLGYRHCCNTNYCNHATTKHYIGSLMISIISGTIMGVFN